MTLNRFKRGWQPDGADVALGLLLYTVLTLCVCALGQACGA